MRGGGEGKTSLWEVAFPERTPAIDNLEETKKKKVGRKKRKQIARRDLLRTE